MKEKHITKFETEFISKELPSDFRIEELKKFAKLFSDHELAPPYPGGSHGNLSFRVAPEESPFVITASQTSLAEELEAKDFTTVDFVDFENNKVIAQGERLPSSESMIHGGIYMIREDVNAVFHGHCEYILKKVKELGLPETREEKDFGTIALVEQVLNVAENNNFLVIKNHGFIALGKSMKEAWMETVRALGLPDALISELLD